MTPHRDAWDNARQGLRYPEWVASWAKRENPVNTDQHDDRHLEVTYLTGRFLGEHLTRVYHLFDGDLIAAIVLATVAQHNLQRFYDAVSRGGEAFDDLVENEQHITHMRHCNALSVSGATGVPRETVRRKVRMLEAKGWLRVGERGELLVAPRIGKRFAAFDRQTNAEFERYARKVLKIIDAKRRAHR